jgi:hypothetical protein
VVTLALRVVAGAARLISDVRNDVKVGWSSWPPLPAYARLRSRPTYPERTASRLPAIAPYDRAMLRLRLLRLLAAGALVLLLIVPALALAKVKRGTYIEVKTQTYIATNAAATKIKSLNIPCIYNGQQYGGNLITKALKISGGKFSFDGKSTLRGVGTNSVIDVTVTGKFANGKITGKVTYLAPAPCTTRAYSAKYYGVNPQG